MSLLWASYELLMNFLWTSYELLISFLRTSYELLLNILWTSYEHLMNILWTLTNVFQNLLWTSYKRLTNILLWYLNWELCLYTKERKNNISSFLLQNWPNFRKKNRRVMVVKSPDICLSAHVYTRMIVYSKFKNDILL